MPLLGINCLDSFLNFRNRKKPKSSKQKISAFFILTKLPLLLFSISHSSRFPFLLTPIPPLLPIFPFFTPTHPTPPYFLLPFSPTPLTSSHPSLSFAPTHPIFSHAPFSLFQYAPFLHIPFSYIPTPPPFPIPSHVFFSSKSNHTRSPKNTSSPKSKTRKSPCPFSMQHALRRTIIFFSPTKKINAHPASPKMPFFQNFRLSHFPAEFSQFSFPPHSLFPHKNKKRINPFGFILFVSLISESVYKFQISFWGS